MPEAKEKEKAGSFLRALAVLLKDYFFAVVAAAVIALLLRVYVLEAFRIPTDLMSPSLLAGDNIFVNKLAYSGIFGIGSKQPRRGDVIVFSFPSDPTKDYIKRVIAVAGDTVELRDSIVYVNGMATGRVIEGPAKTPTVVEEGAQGIKYQVFWDKADPDARKMTAVIVPKDKLFVLGDNRSKGQDSRSWGFLPKDSIQGKASIILLSVRYDDSEGSRGVRWERTFSKVR